VSHPHSSPLTRNTAGRRRWWIPVAVAILAGSALFGTAKPAAAASLPSSDEAGYIATGASGAFTSVSSSWTVPIAQCTGASTAGAAFWVGLDGYTSADTEQVGTLQECYDGAAYYYGWYEFYPTTATIVFGKTVEPGDAVSASVTYAGSNQFTVKLTDTTQGWSQSQTTTLTGIARSSAEVLAEAFSESGTGPVSPPFRQVSYTSAMVNKAGLCKASPMAVTASNLTVSAISDCTNFTVTATHTAPQPG